MRLENLYPNFLSLPESNQLAFVASYRKKRVIDLTPAPNKRDISKVDISFSPEEEVIRKMLGLTKKDFMQLKALAKTSAEEEREENEDARYVDFGRYEDGTT